MNIRILNNENIHGIYAAHVVKPESYFQRFENIRSHFTTDEFHRYNKLDPPRVISLVDFREWIVKYGLTNVENLLSTCNTDSELLYVNCKHRTDLPYPPHDLHTFDIQSKEHDFVIFNQTIEHLHTPILALNRISHHMKVGGYIYTTVPTINIPHMTPIHFNGYTPVGLCALMISAGFEVCECGYWGNKKYLDYIFTHNTWPNDLSYVMTDNKMTYDPVCQAQTWILARKPA